MAKPARNISGKTGRNDHDDVIRRQRKLIVDALVKEFYPDTFSAGQLLKKKGDAKIIEG
ncbi:MAG: hypothetical protein A4E62_01152 [Syntrophorhabdus sp. PtaU1.Bin002]|nr:MAG: hypothetical protein A4E62_01152 [Syntrophorhabdus sp. PtaU1.Bin002]